MSRDRERGLRDREKEGQEIERGSRVERERGGSRDREREGREIERRRVKR